MCQAALPNQQAARPPSQGASGWRSRSFTSGYPSSDRKGRAVKLLEAAPPAPDLAPGQVVVRTVGAGGLAPVVIADQALQPGRRYRIEIHAVDGSRVEIHGSWSQAAVAAGGTLSAPTIEFFEGQTPYRIELSLPMADPARWSCSVSAALKAPPLASGQSALSGPTLAIEILDVTDSQ